MTEPTVTHPWLEMSLLPLHYLRWAQHWPQSWSVPSAAAICSPFWPFLGQSCLLSAIIHHCKWKNGHLVCLKINFTPQASFDRGLTCKEIKAATKALKLVPTKNQLTTEQSDPPSCCSEEPEGKQDTPGMTQPSYLGRRFPKWWETNMVLQSQLFENSFLWSAVKYTCKHVHSSISMAQLRLKFQVPQNIPLINSTQICVTSRGQPEFTEIAFHDTLWSLKIAHH